MGNFASWSWGAWWSRSLRWLLGCRWAVCCEAILAVGRSWLWLAAWCARCGRHGGRAGSVVRMSSAPCFVIVTGQRAALLRCLLIGQTMQTILQILLINTKEGTAKKTGNAYKISEAHCVLRNEDGSAGAVGVLTIPKDLEAMAKPGVFTATFALEAPTYGENQGKVIAALKGLTPVPAGMFKRGSELNPGAAA